MLLFVSAQDLFLPGLINYPGSWTISEQSTYQSLDTLPVTKGRIRRNVSLGRYSWFRAGGAADVFFEPADKEDLVAFLSSLDPLVPVTLIGVGSNMLVSDEGVAGVVVRLGKNFSTIDIDDNQVTADAGAMDVHVARQAADKGVAGLSWLVGVPGTIGGAVRMNAGAYGGDIASCLVCVTGVTRQGKMFTATASELGYGYRHSGAPKDWIYLSAVLQGTRENPEKLRQEIKEISSAREESQPIGARTGGSTFKNPKGYKAWELIDAAGCRGLRIGDAMMSEKHCNFLVNLGNATAHDIAELGKKVQRSVQEHSGISLEWEIQCIGRGFS